MEELVMNYTYFSTDDVYIHIRFKMIMRYEALQVGSRWSGKIMLDESMLLPGFLMNHHLSSAKNSRNR